MLPPTSVINVDIISKYLSPEQNEKNAVRHLMEKDVVAWNPWGIKELFVQSIPLSKLRVKADLEMLSLS